MHHSKKKGSLAQNSFMVAFKVEIEESIVQQVGYNEVERYLQEFAQQLVLKIAAQEALKDLETIDLENNSEWKAARRLAWDEEKHKYFA